MSVGNLPANSDVLIKITYVAELALEGELINFVLPGCVAPWTKDAALDTVTQVDANSFRQTFVLNKHSENLILYCFSHFAVMINISWFYISILF